MICDLEVLCQTISTISSRDINSVIIQQIVTMPIYGNEALNICHPT